ILIQENLQIKSKDILQNNIENILLSVAASFPKNINWINLKDTKWVSPLRNILCLFDNDILHFSFCKIKSNNFTYGHKILIGLNKKIEINSFDDYKSKMEANFVIFDQNERENIIVSKILDIENKLSLSTCGIDKTDFKQNLIKKIVNTTEYPDVFCAEFDKEFLKLPTMIITTVICSNYECFCLKDESQNLFSNKIISFANTKIDNKKNHAILNGLEDVINNKLSFTSLKLTEFLSENVDTKINKLKQLKYHKSFGSVFNKVERIIELSKFICLWMSHCDLLTTEEAAKLCKIDSATILTKDNPILKGYLSSYYAEVNSYPKEVCEAIGEYYEPRNVRDPIPTTDVGKVISLAGRIDNIIMLFIMNEQSNSSEDPYGIRKNITTVIKILAEGEISIPFQVLVLKSISLFKTGIYKNNNETKITVKQKINQIKEDITDLCRERFASFLKDCGYKDNIISLIFSKENKQGKPTLNVYTLYKKLSVVNDYIEKNPEKILVIKNTYKRIKRILIISKIEKKIPLFIKLIRKLHKKTKNENLLTVNIKDLKIDIRRENKLQNYTLCLDLLYDFSVLLNEYLGKNLIITKNISETNTKLYLMYKAKNIFDNFLYF
ncbi:MAG: glycine--tRNA ligase subunit beta, partial [Rickettsiales bacterium]|nr:glycine--tRNA ligase subunit beta [Rickettsiales bacterium]